MTFVNEYVSDEDIKKYKLDDLVNCYRNDPYKKLPSSVYKHSWTIDKDSNIFLLMIGAIEDTGPSGRPESTGVVRFLLSVNGEVTEFHLRHAPNSSKNNKERPYKIIWDLVKMASKKSIDEKFLSELKNALSTYGYRGVGYSIDDIQVEFKF
jgi:hypothetical protein